MIETANHDIRILIVDDDTAIADVLREYLTNEERLVDACYDGLDAKETIQKERYDLIITDMVMPGLSGLDILKYAKKTNADAVVIIITGYASLETAIAAVREGAYDYIRKPFKLDEIRITVEKAIEKIHATRENRFLLRKLKDTHNELVILKREKSGDHKVDHGPKVTFFSSDMTAFPYLYDSKKSRGDSVDKIKALSSLKENGLLSDMEFTEFKKHLLYQLGLDERD
jgi:DNA-binding response OmpR family regulator